MELLYFKVANHFNIVDKPNNRSSHANITIRGGGIIFIMSLLVYGFFFDLHYPYFLAGAIIISLISFLDDLKPVSNKIRIFFHLISVILLFHQVGILYLHVYLVISAVIIAIGIINAINFMDGINGITAGYALVALVTLWYIDKYAINYTDGNLIITVILGVIVFGFFNFRTKARCFAGDVGSVSIAFVLIFFIVQLVVSSGNPIYVLLLLVYGLDASTTIIFRLIRGENIFEAHRSHFYQYLSNERKIPQVYVAICYSIAQLLINVLVFRFLEISLIEGACFLMISVLAFVALRFTVEGSSRLMK
ncbi:MAG: UDP-GlcNAc--UDP-phosphate GlcNAc-1-phosphate transferase [Pedobacter sp.]